MVKGKLREQVMELYSSVISYGGRPSPYQFYYTSVLEEKIKEKKREFTKFKKKLMEINKSLRKAGLPLIKELTKEEFEARG